MVVERFSQNMLNSGLFRVYIGTGFFASLIFFVINADLFTPVEMIVGIMGITVVLKGLSNLMLSLVISFFSLDNKRDELNFRYNAENIDSLMNELKVKEVVDANNKIKSVT